MQERSKFIYASLYTPDEVWGRSYLGDGSAAGDTLLAPNQGAYADSLKQSSIKTPGKVVKLDGTSLSEVGKEA
jgi:hypothetical protein